MAVKQEIEITIAPDGSISFEVKGVKGKTCLDITKDLENELGVVTSRQNTSEYYQEESNTVQIKLGD